MQIKHKISRLGIVSLSTTIDGKEYFHWDNKLVEEERWQALRKARVDFRKRLRKKGVLQ